jgi:hypothetical protein
MPQFNYGDQNPFAAVQEGINFSQGMIDKQAQRQAGNMLAQTSSPAAAALFKSGQLDAGSRAQAYGQDQQDRVQAQQKQAIADHLTFLTKAATALSQIPDDGTQSARRQALAQHILPTLQQMGASPQDLQQLQSADLSDQALSLFVNKANEQLQIVGGDNGSYSAVNKTNGQLVRRYDAPSKVEYKDVPAGGTLVQVGGPGGATAPAQPDAATAPAAAAGQPRGIRDNNPLNLQPLAQGQWSGQTGTDGRYATFASPEAGMAAADRNLQTYASKYGINTVSGIINRWSPPSENNTAAYIQTVAHDLGVDPNAKLDLNNPQVRKAVLTSMSKVELGQSAPAAASAQPSAQGGARVVFQAPPKDDGEDAPLSKESIHLLAGKWLLNGQLPAGMGKQATADRRAIINEGTALANELGLTPGDLVAGTASIKALGSALGKASSIRTQVEGSEATVEKNAQQVLALAPKGGGPTGVPVLNRWIQAGRKNIAGDPDVAAFNLAIGTVADEYAKVMTTATGTGGATSDTARAEAYKRLSNDMTLPALQKTIAQMQIEMDNRTSSLRDVEAGIRTQIRSGGGSIPQPGAAPPATGGPSPAPPRNRPALAAIFGR